MNSDQSRFAVSRSGREAQTSSEGAAARLNSEQSAGTIVRTFVAEWLHQAATSPSTAATWLDEECRRMNLLWLGLGLAAGRYSELVRSDWNSPDQLGRFLGASLGLQGETQQAACDAFADFAQEVRRLAEIRDKDVRTVRLDKVCHMFSGLLQGIPFEVRAWADQ